MRLPWNYFRFSHALFASIKLFANLWKNIMRTIFISLSIYLSIYLSFVRLIWIVFEKGSKYSHSSCFVGCCFQDFFNIARSILKRFPSSFFSVSWVSVRVVHPYSRAVTIVVWKKPCFVLSDRSDFYMIDNLSIVVLVACLYIFQWIRRHFHGK